MKVVATAHDEAGVVAGMEVSLDGGKRWHPMEHSSEDKSWVYVFSDEPSDFVYAADYSTLAVAELYVWARAMDDSANLGEPIAYSSVKAEL